MESSFAGKTAIVTGAASGICRVILQSFVRQGAGGVIADVNEEWGQQVAQGLRAEGGTVMFAKTDVRDSASVERTFDETVKAYGGVDILVNCAGVGVHKTIVETSDEEWDFQADTQLRAVFLTCRAAGRRMISQGRGGRILNIGSTAAAVARVRAAPHCASKAGVVQFTKVLALELGPYGITANVVAPGLTDIKQISRAYPSDEYSESLYPGSAPGPARRSAGDRRHRAIFRVGSGPVHHRPGDLRGRRVLGGEALDRRAAPYRACPDQFSARTPVLDRREHRLPSSRGR